MGLAKSKTSTKGLPSQSYDGRLTFVGGFPRIGKTKSVLDELPEPFLFICTDVSNPDVKKLPYVEDTDEGLQYALDNPLKTMAIRCYHGHQEILKVCRDHRRAICLDEIANLFHSYRMKQGLLQWAREVGYCDGGLQAWATSQRAACDVWPGVYTAARRIKWVGPLHDEKAIRTLFSHRSANWIEKDFRAKLANLKPYMQKGWSKPSRIEDSILTVKDI